MKTSRLAHPTRRDGFTLFEVLLALGLTVLLMAAIYSAVNVYQQLTTSGRDQVERLQIVRAVQRQMTVDIRSILFSEPEEEEATDEGMADDGTGEEIPEEPEEVTDPAEAILLSSKGVIGDDKYLVLNLSRPPRGAAYASIEDPNLSGQSSDQISVTYLLATPNDAGLASDAYQKVGERTGLVRMAGDRMKMDQADSAGNTELLASTAVMLAPEVTALEFQYFDGTEWLSSWDSTISLTLPRAIAVRLFVSKIGSDGQPKLDKEGQGIGKWYRFVISVPSADPTPPEALEILQGF